jgi:uncharacterized protein
MLTKTDKAIALEFRNSIVKIISVIDFKVFGSRARGESSEYSDLDVFIKVEDISTAQRQKIREIAFEVGFEKDRLISTFMATRKQIEDGPLGANPIIFKIENEGIRV